MTLSNLTHEDVTQALRLAEDLPDGELILTKGDFSLTIRKGVAGADAPASVRPTEPQAAPSVQPMPQPASSVGTQEPVASEAEAASDAGHVILKAPMLGCFYRSSSPGEPPLADIGSRVAAGDAVCLIEVMKLFNTIAAEVTGTIVAIHVDNGAMVDAGTPLFTVKPD